MNAVFELEVNSLRKQVKDYVCLTSVGKLFHSPVLAEAISIVIGSWQGNSKLVFRISKAIRIKQIAAQYVIIKKQESTLSLTYI